MYDVQNVAEYVITYSEVKDYGISNLKLQKILYLIQAYSLIHTKKPCFSEDIEAWDFGPVIPEVYRKYKQFGSTDIQIRFRRLEEVQKGFEKEDRKRIEEVVDRFADFSAADLTILTQNQAPWNEAFGRKERSFGVKIFWNMYTSDQSGYPDKITVKFEDGAEKVYSR